MKAQAVVALENCSCFDVVYGPDWSHYQTVLRAPIALLGPPGPSAGGVGRRVWELPKRVSSHFEGPGESTPPENPRDPPRFTKDLRVLAEEVEGCLAKLAIGAVARAEKTT